MSSWSFSVLIRPGDALPVLVRLGKVPREREREREEERDGGRRVKNNGILIYRDVSTLVLEFTFSVNMFTCSPLAQQQYTCTHNVLYTHIQ